MAWMARAALVAALAALGSAQCNITTARQNYTCDSVICQGYLAYQPSVCSSTSKCPLVVVIPDWTGLDAYEMERARMLTQWGYVAFGADIYGLGTPVENMAQWGAAAGAHLGNATLYLNKIDAAVKMAKSYNFVDTSRVAVIGYCFGGTGIVNLALNGYDVLGVVGYHSGIAPARRIRWNGTTGSPPIRAKILLHSGAMDDLPQDIATLEGELEAAGATYEIQRFGSSVVHSFTQWGANMPGMAMYNQRADVRSWASTERFLTELFVGPPAQFRGPAECSPSNSTSPSPSTSKSSSATSGAAASTLQLAAAVVPVAFLLLAVQITA